MNELVVQVSLGVERLHAHLKAPELGRDEIQETSHVIVVKGARSQQSEEVSIQGWLTNGTRRDEVRAPRSPSTNDDRYIPPPIQIEGSEIHVARRYLPGTVLVTVRTPPVSAFVQFQAHRHTSPSCG